MTVPSPVPRPRQLRLPTGTSDDVDEDPTGNKALWDRGLLGGASQKADVLCQFHIGETALSLQVRAGVTGERLPWW